MKKLIYLIASVCILSSCDSYLDVNKDPNYPGEVPNALLIPSAENFISAKLGEQIYNFGGFFAQYWDQAVEANQYNDIAEYNHAFEIVGDDRGAKRVLTWSSKVTTLTNIILDNYAKKGLDYLKNTKIWVCDICGFVFIGDVPPEVCPVCKVPSFKILEVK